MSPHSSPSERKCAYSESSLVVASTIVQLPCRSMLCVMTLCPTANPTASSSRWHVENVEQQKSADSEAAGRLCTAKARVHESDVPPF